MPPRLSPLDREPILFAHRGARAHAPENTLEAFRLALRLGATGLESDVWRTADGHAVLDHDGVSGARFRRRPIRQLERASLSPAIPSLAELFDLCPPGVDVSLDIKDPEVLDTVIAVADARFDTARLWICHPDLEHVLSWRDRVAQAKLVHSTRLSRLTQGLERHVADLAAAGIAALNMPLGDWSGGHVVMCHRFARRAFAWDAQHERQLREVLDMGVDAVYSDYVDRMTAAYHSIYCTSSAAPTELQEADVTDWPHPEERPPDDQIL